MNPYILDQLNERETEQYSHLVERQRSRKAVKGKTNDLMEFCKENEDGVAKQNTANA